MGYYEKLLKINMIREAMLDEESRILFDARIDYMITRDMDRFYEISDVMGKGWYCPEVKEILGKHVLKGIIIYGSGHDGQRTKKVLVNCGYSPEYFCDRDHTKVGSRIDGLKVISIEEVLEIYSDYLVILGSAKYAEEMYQSLLLKNFPTQNILYPKHGIITARCGKQYFDVYSAGDGELFVDGGGTMAKLLWILLIGQMETIIAYMCLNHLSKCFSLLKKR